MPRPTSRSSPRLPVEFAELLSHFAEVAQQLPCSCGELLVAVANCRLTEHVDLAGLGLFDLVIEIGSTLSKYGQSRRRIDVCSVNDLAEELDDGVEAGLSTDEVASAKPLDPRIGLLERRGHLVVDLV